MEKKVSDKGFDSVEEYNYDSWASNSKQLSVSSTICSDYKCGLK